MSSAEGEKIFNVQFSMLNAHLKKVKLKMYNVKREQVD